MRKGVWLEPEAQVLGKSGVKRCCVCICALAFDLHSFEIVSHLKGSRGSIVYLQI
jgi:hypothetical protein